MKNKIIAASAALVLAVLIGAADAGPRPITIIPAETESTATEYTGDTTPFAAEAGEESSLRQTVKYVLNISTKRFHYSDCRSVGQMNDSNKREFEGSRENLIADGYKPCGICNP